MSLTRDFHARLASLQDREPFRFSPNETPSHFRRAAVLLPFWSEDGEAFVVLTRRSPKLSQHSGQTADLLLEALDWGIGERPSRGPVRLCELRSFHQR